MGKVIELEPSDVRLWIVYDANDRAMQLFKGPKGEAAGAAEKTYPGRGPFRVVEMVDALTGDIERVTALALADWVCTQFAMIAQATAAVQRAPASLITHKH